MTQEEILALDLHFDFDNAYNQDKWSLFNFAVIPQEDVVTRFVVDGKDLALKYGKKVFCVYYREWRHKNAFQLSDPAYPNLSIFHTSVENAQAWLEIMVGLQQFTKLERTTALKLAEEREIIDGDFIIR